MNTLPLDLLRHVLYPLLRSREVARLAQTCKRLYEARNFTTAITEYMHFYRARGYISTAAWPAWIHRVLSGKRLPDHKHGLVAPLLNAAVPLAQLLRELQMHAIMLDDD